MHRGTTYEERGKTAISHARREAPKGAILVILQLRCPTSATSHLTQDQNHEQTHLWLKPGVCGLCYGGLIRQHPPAPRVQMTLGVPQEGVGLQRFSAWRGVC